MSNIDDGGPAFARPGYGRVSGTEQVGMSLRDWFAGQAMAALLGSMRKVNRDSRECGAPKTCDGLIDFVEPDLEFGDAVNAENIASVSYECADAMIAARKAQG